MASIVGNAQPFTFDYLNIGDVYGLAITLPIVTSTIVALRFYVRLKRKVGLGIDDWLMVPSLGFFLGICITFLIAASHGVMGVGASSTANMSVPYQLEEYVLPSNPLFARLQFAFQLLVILANCFVKMSIIALYQRVFAADVGGAFNWTCRITHLVNLAWTAAFLLLTIFACPADISAQWSPVAAQQNKQCTIAWISATSLVATDLAIDLWLVLLPQPLIWGLQTRFWRRLMVSVIMVLGLSCVGLDIARLVLYAQLRNAGPAHQKLDRDQVAAVNIWLGALDAGIAIIAACLPTLRLLLVDVTGASKRLLSSLSSGSLTRYSLLHSFRGSGGYKYGYRDGDSGSRAHQPSSLPMGATDSSLNGTKNNDEDLEKGALKLSSIIITSASDSLDTKQDNWWQERKQQFWRRGGQR